VEYIIELRSGLYLGRNPLNELLGVEDEQYAKRFRSLDEARMYARHVGIGWYDLWSADGETWCGDHCSTVELGYIGPDQVNRLVDEADEPA
jgi:hypothetical protein